MRRAVFCLADLSGESGPLDLGGFTHARLSENRQQHDGAVRGEPVGDSHSRAVERRPKLTNPAAQVTSVGLSKRFGLFSEQPDILLDFKKCLAGRLSSQERTSGSISTV